ncbi:unnamed protein product [Gongylonema pulchrum]|uniref:GOLD domain-containing protein n=1 Tax=Gongylonema pulchrum TaxID=637853 RepID=A0A183E3A9_9BILA|nr:unnamed protein product [Gongylonema pulchrum]
MLLEVLLTIYCFLESTAYFIHIDANEEQCFFDRVTAGTKMGLIFEVAEGGFLDIDVKVPLFGFLLVPSESAKLEDMVRELSSALTTVKHEQEYMEIRERVHRLINESTNSRVVLWAIFEAVVLVAMSFGQIYYLQRFFEVRRVV